MAALQDIEGIEFPANLEPIRLLGQGSMANVYLARDRNLKRLVAVKFLNPDLCAIEQGRQRFEREAQAAARLSHDGVTTVYSVGRVGDDRPYIEMEYIDGTNLEDLIQSRDRFTVTEACHILGQLASALAAAHDQNIVHRDVKPANILVDNATGAVTLTDFGIAAILQTGDPGLTRLTREGECLGNPRYMSPEQLRGEPLTGQSDIYSLGVVAFELLTGSGPFDDEEIADMAVAHIRRPVPDITNRCTDIPQWLSDVVKRCLSKKPDHRPRAKDLTKVLEDRAQTETNGTSSPSATPVSTLLHELKQRKVYQASAAYAASVFVLLQVVDLLLQPWPRFDIVYQVAVIASVAGFPITVVLAWIYDLQRGRLVKTDKESDSTSNLHLFRRNLVLFSLVVSAALAIIAAWFVLRT